MSLLSVQISGKENLVSKNAFNSMKKMLKKVYEKLENKEDFLKTIENDKETFNKYLKDEYLFTIVKKDETSFKVDIIEDKVKKMEKQKMEREKNKRQKLKNKLKGLRDRRNNVFGRKINNLKKSHDTKLLDKYVAAKKENLQFRPNKDGTVTIGGNTKIEIPDPDEILKDKDKWTKEFKEYKETVDTMEKSSDFFKSTAYYKYITEILETN